MRHLQSVVAGLAFALTFAYTPHSPPTTLLSYLPPGFAQYRSPGGPRDYLPPPPPPCDLDLTPQFRQGLYDFSSYLYKQVAVGESNHFVMSQFSLWRAMSALAEGAEGDARRELLSVLRLPESRCRRDAYYKLAGGLETGGSDVTLARSRLLALDDHVPYNASWASDATRQGLLEVVPVPGGEPDAAAALLRARLGTSEPWPRSQSLAGTRAVLLDSLDFRGLWMTGFPRENTERGAPFYDHTGERIGSVDMMTTRARVKLSYLPELRSRVVELPMGADGRYSMLVLLPPKGTRVEEIVRRFPTTIISDILAGEIETEAPVRVSLPRFTLRTEADARGALGALGVRGLWSGSGGVSDSAFPSLDAVLLRASLTLSEEGAHPAPPASQHAPPDPVTDSDFIANRPFMFGLIDKRSSTCLLTGAYSRPTCHCRCDDTGH